MGISRTNRNHYRLQISQKSREEIEKMFGFSELKQTKVYQEAKQEGKQEGKLEAVPLMLNLGETVEQIAESLGYPC
jgi:predicted transposase/invertase (TIGR01784 family)